MTQTARMLWSLAGPQGPMRSDAETERTRRVLVSGDPQLATSRLLDALRAGAPPADVTPEDLSIEAAELFSELLRAPGDDVLNLLLGALEDPPTRTAALDAIALSADQRAARPLAELVRRHSYEDWSERELVKLASALGSLSGAEARGAIAALAAHGGWPSVVQNEIDLAAESVG